MIDPKNDDEARVWIQNLLSAEGEVTLTPLTPDASSRRYYRVNILGDRSYILSTEDSFDPLKQPFLLMQQLLSSKGVPVPEIFGCLGPKGLILQEDFGDTSLQDKILGVGSWSNNSKVGPVLGPKEWAARAEWSRKAVDQIINIQSIKKNKEFAAAPCFGLSFDQAKLGFEWGWTWTHLIEGFLEHQLDVNQIQNWVTVTQQISEHLEAKASVLAHRDFHSRNLMVVGDQLGIIDFQDARMASRYYDLVSLLYDSYLPFSAEMETEVLDYFNYQSKQKFIADEYYDQALQRVFKALGSFASFYKLKGDARYLKYIRPTLNLLRHILKQHSKRSGLESIVEKLVDKWESYP